MSNLTPKELTALLSGGSERTQDDDLEAMIARLDAKWWELKRLLRAQEHGLLEELPDFQAGQSEHLPAENTTQEADSIRKSWWQSLLFGDEEKIGVPAQKTDVNMQQVEKLDEDAEIRERLARIERQNFSLTIYAIVCTLLILFMVFSSYFLQASYASSKTNVGQAAQPQMAAATGTTNPAIVTAPAPQAPVLPISEVPDSQKTPAAMSTPQEPATPSVEYVGSRTSNKYHYRSCKWVKYINPKNERVFHSVAEAQKAGYIRCPTCRPPLTDETQTSAR
jgi:hypothetical protein